MENTKKIACINLTLNARGNVSVEYHGDAKILSCCMGALLIDYYNTLASDKNKSVAAKEIDSIQHAVTRAIYKDFVEGKPVSVSDFINGWVENTKRERECLS